MVDIGDWKLRTELQIGKDNIEKLHNMNVLVAGLGGVGAYAAEMICRAGVGNITIVDGDIVQASNINRQLPSLHSTVGFKKAKVMASRMKDINPQLSLTIIDEYIKDEGMEALLEKKFDYVVDAIDTLSPKNFLIYNCVIKGIPIVSSMGAGGKYDPSLIKVSDISESNTCKLAQILRKRLHKHGIYKGFKVIYSPEVVNDNCIELVENEINKRSIVGTISYMPAIFGCYCASVVIRELLE